MAQDETAFDQAVAAILGSPNPEERAKWTDALRDSLNIRGNFTIPMGPGDIISKYAVSSLELLTRHIVIDPVEASELIKAVSPGEDEVRVLNRAFKPERHQQLFGRPLFFSHDGRPFVTYAELFASIEKPVPAHMQFKELSRDTLPLLCLWVDPGTAPAHRISALLHSISDLYRDCGGSGINFDVSEVRSFQRETA